MGWKLPHPQLCMLWWACSVSSLLIGPQGQHLDRLWPLCPVVARSALSRSLPMRGCLEPPSGRSSIFCWLAFCSDCAPRRPYEVMV